MTHPLRTTSWIRHVSRLESYHVPRRCVASSATQSASPVVPGVPPESPNFIQIPRAVQPQAVYRNFMKGVLPVPRKVLHASGVDKNSTEFLNATSPEPSSTRVNRKSRGLPSSRTEYRMRGSDRRRTNLKEGLSELQIRTDRAKALSKVKRDQLQKSNRAKRDAEELDAEVLMRPSTLKANSLSFLGNLPDHNREERLARKRENVAKQEAAQMERRQRLLHNLYVNAGSFITTPEKLDKVIDNVFDDKEQFSTSERIGYNIWNLGFPDTTQDMLGNTAGGKRTNHAPEGVQGGKKHIHEQRIRKLGEELTGGKIQTS